jgi:hypothetical protein
LPSEFLWRAEETGLIEAIGQWYSRSPAGMPSPGNRRQEAGDRAWR